MFNFLLEPVLPEFDQFIIFNFAVAVSISKGL
jgi:hypothetical protein